MTTTIEPISSLAPASRPVVVSSPLAGEVAIALPVQAAGVVYLAQLAWRRGDPLEATAVLLDPEPPAHRDVLAVLDAIEDTCKARHTATPDPHNAVLWRRPRSGYGPMPLTTATPGPPSASRARPSPPCKPLTVAGVPIPRRRPHPSSLSKESERCIDPLSPRPTTRTGTPMSF